MSYCDPGPFIIFCSAVVIRINTSFLRFTQMVQNFHKYIFLTAELNLVNSLDICLKYTVKVLWKWLRMQEMAFVRAQISMLPRTPLEACAFSTCFVVNRLPFSLVVPGYCSCLNVMTILLDCFRLTPQTQISKFEIPSSTLFLLAPDSETLICDAKISRLV